jgi:excinuclease ABC subunit B
VLLRQLTRSSTCATTSTSSAARSACAATSSRSSPSYEDDRAIRFELFGDELEAITRSRSAARRGARELDEITIYPTTPLRHAAGQLSARWTRSSRARERLARAARAEEAARGAAPRTAHALRPRDDARDGTCQGIENYSRHLDGRAPGQPPATLLNYFPDDFLLVVDESHVAMPQIGGMYRGDRARKETLVEYGFRLPSARSTTGR